MSQLDSINKPSTLSGADFELIVYENCVINARSTPFEGLLRHTDDREFPDIVAADLFGIEVKATKKDDWTSIGNSVLESSRVKSVEKIYMFFGKLGGTPDIKYRKYEECLKGISVTHYPRYQIDMLLSDGDSIFKKMGTDYDNIRNSANPVRPIRAYYKKQLKEGDALWWIGDETDEMPELSPIIRSFTSIDINLRNNIKAEVFILFPEVLSNNPRKYERIAGYMAARYGVVSSSLRDQFSAGGQEEFKVDGVAFRVPKIVKELYDLAPIIRSSLASKNQLQLADYWRKEVKGFSSSEEAWIYEIDRYSAHMKLPVKVSELYVRSANRTTRVSI